MPMASPAWVRESGPTEAAAGLDGMPLLRSPLEIWRTWFAVPPPGLSWRADHSSAAST